MTAVIITVVFIIRIAIASSTPRPNPISDILFSTLTGKAVRTNRPLFSLPEFIVLWKRWPIFTIRVHARSTCRSRTKRRVIVRTNRENSITIVKRLCRERCKYTRALKWPDAFKNTIQISASRVNMAYTVFFLDLFPTQRPKEAFESAVDVEFTVLLTVIDRTERRRE